VETDATTRPHDVAKAIHLGDLYAVTINDAPHCYITTDNPWPNRMFVDKPR